MSHLISPSILSCDFANIQRDVELLNSSKADWLHIDIMDGVFVPNISFGFPVLEVIKKHAKKPLDVHLMITNPDQYIDDFHNCGAEILTVHYEACTHLHRTIELIKSKGMKASVALNPHTNVMVLEDLINDIDMVLIMSVNPGFGGQKFINNSLLKVKQTKDLIQRKSSKAIIEVDGGVNNKNAPSLIKSGADVLVAGSHVFNSKDPVQTIVDLKSV